MKRYLANVWYMEEGEEVLVGIVAPTLDELFEKIEYLKATQEVTYTHKPVCIEVQDDHIQD